MPPKFSQKALINPSEVAALKEAAKQAFFAHQPNTTIQQIAGGISATTLATWRREGDWALEREALERGIIEDGFAVRKLSIARILNNSTDQVERGLRHLMARSEPPSLQEMERLSVILSNLDRVGRLDSGKSTDNVAVSAKLELNAETIRQIIFADPAEAYKPPVSVVAPDAEIE